MKYTDKIKIAFVAVFTAINGWLGVLEVIFWLLLYGIIREIIFLNNTAKY